MQFDPSRVDRVLDVFSRLRHTQGKWAGRPLTPDLWQVAYILAPVFGWVYRDEVQPRSSAESSTDARDMVTTGWRIYSRAGADLDIEPTDRVEWAGRTLEVIGEIARWPHPVRPHLVHHVEVDVQKVSG